MEAKVTSSTLKMIACISMLVDHIGAVLYPEIFFLRIIGRLAFPIFAFLIVEGYFHTKNISKYLLRLGVFAIVSEVPFDLTFWDAWLEFTYQNVFFTLFIGLVAIWIYDINKENNKTTAVMALILLTLVSILLKTDYNMFGVLMIFGFYQYRKRNIYLFTWLLTINGFIVILSISGATISIESVSQIFAVLSLGLIFIYNGKKGINLKYLFYAFYPVHLLILHVVSLRS